MTELEEPWEDPFFVSFANGYGSIAAAAAEVGVTTEIVEQRCKDSPKFASDLAFFKAHLLERLLAELDSEAIRRALEPERVPIVYRGRIIGYQEKYDNRHLEWMLERINPEKFHLQTRLEAGTQDGETVFRLELAPGSQKKEEAV